jgi:hypothetical protein
MKKKAGVQLFVTSTSFPAAILLSQAPIAISPEAGISVSSRFLVPRFRGVDVGSTALPSGPALTAPKTA